MNNSLYKLEDSGKVAILRLTGTEPTNTLSRARVLALTEVIHELSSAVDPKPLILTGNDRFFSAGADLNEISHLTGPQAYDFAAMGQVLMSAIANYPARTIAAVSGYCMGGGLDLALACDLRIAAPNAIFGHRGAALGLITGWGGTQRLPRLVGKARALQMFLCAEKLHAAEALSIRLVHEVADDPVARALHLLESTTAQHCVTRPRHLR